MPQYQITVFRGVNLVGLTASSTSTIYAEDIYDAQLTAQCSNQPKGEWNIINGVHIKGEVEDGNVSIVIPLEDPEIIEYDIRLAFQKETFKKSRVFQAFSDFLILSKTQQHMLEYTYIELLKKKENDAR